MGFLKLSILSFAFKRFYTVRRIAMKYLNVAEKNDAAKNIAGFLSRGAFRRREGLSPYNKIYEFEASVHNQNVTMIMTSVSGHLLNYEFVANFRSWKSCNPVALFDAPVMKACNTDGEKIKATLEREIKNCSALIVWTDCDREGENIGFEIIKVCTAVKPNIRIYRAKFSEITAGSIQRALNNIGEPDKNISDAVDVRQEMDLRTGAAFTRLQTLHLSKVFPQKLTNKLISYGSCQFPTLGFVVERFKDIENFIPEDFWKIKMAHTKNQLTVEYQWERDRLFRKKACEALFHICQENPTATVLSVISKQKIKWRPVPLDTVEMEKTISRKLKINAKETMKIAERLYTQGFISYPRTETNIFPPDLNLRMLVEQQTNDQRWGSFANRILNDGGPTPRQGKKSDQAHPPIHPTKHAPNLNGNEHRVYEYIVRHFLACCSKDAVGFETIIKVNVADELFTAKGLNVLEKKYLEVYIYEKWNAKEIHNYTEGENFQPSILELAEGSTTAPKLLTEADLIALMEKNGIGTDATHADHIDTIKSREYVGLHDNIYFIPGTLGMGLVEGYDSIGLEVSLAKPVLRAEFEADLKLICEGRKDPQVVLQEQIAKYRAMFHNVVQRLQDLEQKLSMRIEEQRQVVDTTHFSTREEYQCVFKCPKCGRDMILKKRKNQDGFYLSCCGYPTCKNAIWFPTSIQNLEVLNNSCQNCGVSVKKLKFKFRQGQNPFVGEPSTLELCIGGCDINVLETFDIALSSVMKLDDATPVHQTQSQSNFTTRSANSQSSNIERNITQINSNNRPNTINNTLFSNGNSQTNNNSHNSWDNSSRNVNNPSSSSITSIGSINNSRNYNNVNHATRSDSGYNSWIRPTGSHNLGCPSESSTSAVTTVKNNRINPTVNNRNIIQSNMNIANILTDAVCDCGNPAVLLTVRKEGPNLGRQFYKCQGNTCNFFLWASNMETVSQSSNSFGPSIPLCNCRQPAVQRTVQKDNANKGRTFYSCAKVGNGRCNFFKWASDDDGNGTGGGFPGGGGGGGDGWFGQGSSGGNTLWSNSRGSRGKGKTRSSKRKAPSSYNSGRKSKRKCGICGEEGHVRTHCPNKTS